MLGCVHVEVQGVAAAIGAEHKGHGRGRCRREVAIDKVLPSARLDQARTRAQGSQLGAGRARPVAWSPVPDEWCNRGLPVRRRFHEGHAVLACMRDAREKCIVLDLPCLHAEAAIVERVERRQSRLQLAEHGPVLDEAVMGSEIAIGQVTPLEAAVLTLEARGKGCNHLAMCNRPDHARCHERCRRFDPVRAGK